jgi:hypothetical protein
LDGFVIDSDFSRNNNFQLEEKNSFSSVTIIFLFQKLLSLLKAECNKHQLERTKTPIFLRSVCCSFCQWRSHSERKKGKNAGIGDFAIESINIA